ncbi:anaerobic sulfatase maturase [Neisseriaceae bacterium JH1-16]|nr:anaerobic sulfatase maturase [Neisseriaceae bacterium JH1-16]
MHYSDTILSEAKRLHISPEALQTYLDAGAGKPSPGVSRYLHTTIKPAGSACNLDCNYCYYLSKEDLLNQNNRRIDETLLETFIKDYINSQDVEEIAFTWHGGEPTLLGVGFFRKVVALQARHTPAGRRVSNDLQTNGTLLDDEWGAFLAEHRFLVGLSIDGPRELHDAYRPTKKGKPSFDAVFAATQLLKRHGVPFSTLTTVNRKNAKRPLEVYRFLRDEVGSTYMQFIPCVEPKQFERTAPGYLEPGQLVDALSPRTKPGHPLSVVTDWSVESEDWGGFLSMVFDEWVAHDLQRVKVNLFETTIAQMKGQPAMICTSSPFCGKNVALEHDGRVYACDHFVYPEYEIGKVGEKSLGEMVFSIKQLEFGLNKFNTLPGECRKCPYLKLCYGECPRTRILKTRPGEGNLSYLCRGWKKFFSHAVPTMKRLC